MSLLDRIYYEASTTAYETLIPEELLSTMYERIPAAADSYARMRLILDNSGMKEEQLDEAYIAWEQSCLDDERQGFLNGFRFGFRLAQELLGTAGLE